jgi:4-carboxymuconolactone decarboxylase
MATLEDRYLASYPVLAGLGRADANGIPLGSPMMEEIAPDQWRIICEACFGWVWNRPALSLTQRSLATISIITALRRDDNLKGHIYSGLDLGPSPEQIVEIMLQLIFYTGAPIANTGLGIANAVFKERGLKVNPIRAHNINEDPEELYQRGLAKRREVMGESFRGDFQEDDELDQDWERYTLEYIWGSVWTRSGLDLPSRCICTLSALTLVGTENSLRHYTLAARRVGLTEAQIKELFYHLNFYIGQSLARRALSIAREAFRHQGPG